MIMKKTLLFMTLALLLAAGDGIAQTAPAAINYQAVLRESSGALMAAKDVRVRLTVHAGTAGGTTEYQETHSVTTSAQGLVNLQLGGGTAGTGTFAGIDWTAGAKYLQVEVLDLNGGSGYVDLGTQQLVSVPYALYANHAREAERVTGMNIDDLGDVNTGAPGSGQVLKWNGSAWAAADDEDHTVPSGPAGGALQGTYPNPGLADSVVTIPKLNLSNDATAAAADWQGLKLPYVDFSSTATFADSSVWGIKGQSANGTVVFNPGYRLTNGFKGTGYYGWINGAWVPLATGDGFGGPGRCVDPGQTIGSLGCVTFTYRGAQVTHTTVRAADGNIWLQQNLGASRVATSTTDASSYGDLFQWGRWDDGHQARNSTTAKANTLSANNPSGIPTGSPNFIISTNGGSGPFWWSTGAGTNTWSGTTVSATNGRDPCVALGTGWRMPTKDEWLNMLPLEGITGNVAQAFASNLKVPYAGDRSVVDGVLQNQNSQALFWTSEVSSAQGISILMQSSQVRSATSYRGGGNSVRCIKK